MSGYNYFDDVGAYLLGALQPDEHEAFERAARRRRAPARRGRPPARSPSTRCPNSPGAVRRRRRPQGPDHGDRAVRGAAAATPLSALTAPDARAAPPCAVAPGLASGARAGRDAARGDRRRRRGRCSAATTSASSTPQLGDAQLIDKGDGGHATLVVENLDPPGPGRVYQVWLQHEGQAPAPTNALFSTSSDGTASVDVPGSLEDVEAVLVTEEPEGGSQAPTTAAGHPRPSRLGTGRSPPRPRWPPATDIRTGRPACPARTAATRSARTA